MQTPGTPIQLPLRSTSIKRLACRLEEALGPTIGAALDEPTVVEIMLNPDGKVFVERMGQGITLAGALETGAAETIIGLVAHALQTEVNQDRPIISGELPINGHRFEGLLPPVVGAPSFSIRKRASMLIPLDAYVAEGVMTAVQAETIRNAVAARMNIVIAGGTGSGKTTLANAIIGEIVRSAPEQRIVVLEDTAEIRCAARNAIMLHSSETVDMARLLKSTMRLRPDRIIVGEVRDGAALTLLKAWNTGHPGGIATIHANDARSALVRLEHLVAEVSTMPMHEVIGEAIDLVISIERANHGRRIKDILFVEGFRDGGYQTESCLAGEPRHVA